MLQVAGVRVRLSYLCCSLQVAGVQVRDSSSCVCVCDGGDDDGDAMEYEDDDEFKLRAFVANREKSEGKTERRINFREPGIPHEADSSRIHIDGEGRKSYAEVLKDNFGKKWVALESTRHRGGDAGRVGYWFGLVLTGLLPAFVWPLTVLVGTTLVR
ncbi:hypothetical protein L6452_41037 [Arctium lappa]|uniref:Uncharacterized protein n=1 Tax=Arctium lappa TaxID=4217 RepID=A0ACB8XPD0_ARCLA|nr:hypothetical protein L6452_41037 [Arctium lappa]